MNETKFLPGDIIKHGSTGGFYLIVLPASRLVLERTGMPAYGYVRCDPAGRSFDDRVWLRDAAEMEDGRFTLMARPDQPTSWPPLA